MSETAVSKKAGQKGYGLIATLVGLVFAFIIGVLVLRFIFRLFGANPDAAIVSWVYSMSAPFLAPFYGIFNTSSVDLATGQLEVITLIAIVVYGLIASLLERATSWGGWHRPVA